MFGRHDIAGSSVKDLTSYNQDFGWNLFLSGGQEPLLNSYDFWQSSVVCGCRTNVPIFLLAVYLGPFSLLEPTQCSLIVFLPPPWPSHRAACFFKASSQIFLF